MRPNYAGWRYEHLVQTKGALEEMLWTGEDYSPVLTRRPGKHRSSRMNHGRVVGGNVVKDVHLMKYDDYLRKALKHLFDHWLNAETGLVVAALVVGDKGIYATSTLNPDGTWKHAERNALETFEAAYGQPPSKDAMMLVSLSPCIRDAGSNTSFGDLKNAASREGESCSTLLRQYGITHIGFGIIDSLDARSVADYTALGFNVVTISDRTVLATCKALNGMFPRILKPQRGGQQLCCRQKAISWISVMPKDHF